MIPEGEKIVQIATGPITTGFGQGNNPLTDHVLYVLTDAGDVYRWLPGGLRLTRVDLER